MKTKKIVVCGLLAVLFALNFIACGGGADGDGGFVAVTSITGVPTSGTEGPLTLAGTVNPANATNKAITWSRVSAGTTGANISGNTLTTTAAGTVTVRATIANGLGQGTPYTQDFSITINAAITYTAIQTGGVDGTSSTNTIAFTFSNAVTRLEASDITITDGTGSVTKGSLTGSGTSWSLGVTVTAAGNITVSIDKSGIETATKGLLVYRAGQIAPGTPGLAYEAIGSPATAYLVKRGTVNSGAVNIPATYENLPVTEIEHHAFYGCTGLTSVTIPSSVTSIGGGAFYRCTGLTNITIPASVTSIGDSAFFGCTGLTSITIPAGVSSIENSTFYGCTGLTSVTIPSSVTSIGGYAFYDCTGLTSAIIPAGVQFIGNRAFEGCWNLSGITIPANVISIGEYAFSGCSFLTSVTIPAGVTYIGTSPFSNCRNLTSITVDANNQKYASENSILYNKAKTTLIQAPGGISGSVTVSASITSIGEDAFSGCVGLTSITVDASNPNYASEGGIVYNKAKTAIEIVPRGISGSVTISAGVTRIRLQFFGCTGLAAITIPAGVEDIADQAFAYCTGLTSVTFATGSVVIGGIAFPPESTAGPGGSNYLKTAYLAGGAGTYTRASDGEVWTKQ